MLSCETQLARLGAGNFDHWPASCRFALCSSFTQLFIDWSTERPTVAATSSLQLRATSKFGTPSATATTICELKTIIEKEIGIPRLLQIATKAQPTANPAWMRRECAEAGAAGAGDGWSRPSAPALRNRVYAALAPS
jgi:hypothetical protein